MTASRTSTSSGRPPTGSPRRARRPKPPRAAPARGADTAPPRPGPPLGGTCTRSGTPRRPTPDVHIGLRVIHKKEDRMGLSPVTETFETDDPSWLGSAHGTDSTQTGTLL